MRHLTILGFFISMMFAGNVTAQEYYEIYPLASAEVQNKMNDNKMNGVAILSDIKASHVIGISGVSVSQKNTLIDLFNNNAKVHTTNINDAVTSIILDAEASLTKNEIQLILDQVNGIITAQTVEYSTDH